jgi:hypothetical protein
VNIGNLGAFFIRDVKLFEGFMTITHSNMSKFMESFYTMSSEKQWTIGIGFSETVSHQYKDISIEYFECPQDEVQKYSQI